MNINDILPLVKELYQTDYGCTGCCLHIALDDGNLKRIHLEFCLQSAKERNHKLCIEIAEKMLQLSKTQRYQVYIRKFRESINYDDSMQ